MQTGLSQESAMQKLYILCSPPTGEQNYAYLVEIWEKEKTTIFNVFLRRYINKDVVPTLEVMHKNIGFCHNKGIDMLKLGGTLPN